MKIKFILFLGSLMAVGTLFGLPTARADSVTEKTWQLSNSVDFNVQNADKVKFSNGSVKIIPTGAESVGYYPFYDGEYGAGASLWAMDIEVDGDGNFYIGGNINPNEAEDVNNWWSFIEKRDSNFNLIWNKKYFLTPGWIMPQHWQIFGGVNDIAFSPVNGYLYISAFGVTLSGETPTESIIHVLKINPEDGNVVWEKTKEKTVHAGATPWANVWDEGTGPKFDSDGNFFVTYSDGCAANKHNTYTGMPGPVVIVKYDSDGNELWSRSADLIEGRTGCAQTFPAYEDVWESVVDSEGSVYFSASYWSSNLNMNYIVTKYNSDGTFAWRDTRDFADIATGGWDSPRSLSIDSNDYIYVNGNPPVNSTQSCLLRKLDKDGNVIIDYQNLNPTGTRNDFAYCWGAQVDEFDRWVAIGSNGTKMTTAYYKKSGESQMVLESVFNQTITGFSSNYLASHKSIFDRFGNFYGISHSSTNADGYKQYIIHKSRNTYPNTLPSAGDENIIYLTNKTPQSYTTLNGFTVGYGTADQADVQFQISNDGTTWYYWNGSDWMQVVGYESSTAADINSNISKFSDKFGPGQFYFKAFMLTDGTKQVDLASVKITHDLPISTTLSVLPATGRETAADQISRLLAKVFIKIEKVLNRF